MKFSMYVFIALFLSPTLIIHPQEPNFAESNKLQNAAIKQYEKKEYDSMLINMQQALLLRPNHPRILYNLAISFTLNNKKKEALNILNKMAEMGLDYMVENDSDFDLLMKDEDFIKVANKLKENHKPIINSVVKVTYPEKDLITESVAYDSQTGTFYLSSIHKRKIVKINKEGKTEDFKSEGEDGLQSVFGMKIDEKNRLLYACSSPIEQMKGFSKDNNSESALYKYNLDSGDLLHKYAFNNEDSPHIFGDLVIDKDGNVYVSDTRENSVYKFYFNSEKFEQIIKPGKFVNLQGLDLDETNSNLYMVDYALGLYRYNLESGELVYIEPSEFFVPQGIDGLYFYNNSLIATQNGISPQRVIKIHLNDEKNKVVKWETIETNNPLFDEITLGLINGDDFYFIANGQWGSFNKDGSIFPMDKLKNPVVLHIKL